MDKGQGNDNLEILRELLTVHTFDAEVQVFDHEANDTHDVLQHTKTWVHEFEAQQGALDNLHDIESKVQSKPGEAEGIVATPSRVPS
ncbi:hypothetical protein LACPH_002121 [Lacticaseibacillus parahuelsenbergensis]|uniref:Uncharacterized protein n=1 Tax=Lacticaseibacillus parahuelsenbergensis TaxID=3068305 RepID=A0ABY9L0T4_9LACO|nr:hypothetical protein [Lacticaseibacillus sp. NCIMB 15471]WLV77377.1 hypothetical protein LACPH_002121 [Lacticaseibacillus sp. NCIMB 15471]